MRQLYFYCVVFAGFIFASVQANAQQGVTVDAASPLPVSQAMPVSPVVPRSDTVSPATAPLLTPVSVPSGQTPLDPVSAMIPAPSTPIEKGISDQIRLIEPKINVNLMPSLFYSTWEHDLIIDARRGITPGNAIVDEASFDPTVQINGPRDVSLSGIVYISSKEWTIWLNGIRVTPKAIPEAIMNLKVSKEYIELDWFDNSTNQIFPIRLRAHQRFNLDTRIFLPG